MRPFFDVAVVRLTPGAFDFVAALAEGRTLQTAAEAVLAKHPAFDLNTTLEMLFRCGAVVGVRLGTHAEPFQMISQTANPRTVSCAN